MQLQSPPLGKDFFETEKILLDIQKKMQLNYFALPETFWILYPPIGPRPAASWGTFPFKTDDENPVSVYIISIEVMYTDGVTRHVVKPGVSRRAIIGHNGRYPKSNHVSLLYEKKGLSPVTAWMCEQKLLMALPRLTTGHPCLRSSRFETLMNDLDEHEDLVLERFPEAIFGLPETYPLTFSEQIQISDELKARRDARRKQIQHPDWNFLGGKKNHWGQSEWRWWPLDETERLIHLATGIVNHTTEINRWP